MKSVLYLLLAVICLVLSCDAANADENLIDLIKQKQEPMALQPYLEPSSVDAMTSAEARHKLKPINAFGSIFTGEVVLKNAVPDQILVWTHDPSISPSAGLDLFEALTDALERELGVSRRIHEIPNYGDGSDVKSSAILWFIGSDIILLKLDRYSSRSGISIVRQSSESWRSGMGADESTFWSQTLDSKAGQHLEPQSGSIDSGRGSPSGLFQETTSLTPSPKKTPSAKPAPTPSKEPTSSTPWGIIVVLIVAALGLLWLLLKRRS